MTEPRVKAGRLLAWRPAEKGDRRDLSVFVCTDPEKAPYSPQLRRRTEHPRQAEFDAQQTIRGRECRVPLPRGCHLWVGHDAVGLAAVVRWQEVDGPGAIHLDVVGVAMRHRMHGSNTAGPIARESILVALNEAEARAIAEGCVELSFEGEIHRTNRGSLRLMQGFGFICVDEYPGGAQTWSRRIPIGDA